LSFKQFGVVVWEFVYIGFGFYYKCNG